MGKKFKTLRLRISLDWYHFGIRFVVLGGAVLVGLFILKLTEHNWLYAGAIARAIELAGEAGADAFSEGEAA